MSLLRICCVMFSLLLSSITMSGDVKVEQVNVGKSLILSCYLNNSNFRRLTWSYKQYGTNTEIVIYSMNDKIYWRNYEAFCQIKAQFCNITLLHAREESAGRYWCKIATRRGQARFIACSIEVVVGEMKCHSNINQHVIGKNDCPGLKAFDETLERYCSLDYYGNPNLTFWFRWIGRDKFNKTSEEDPIKRHKIKLGEKHLKSIIHQDEILPKNFISGITYECQIENNPSFDSCSLPAFDIEYVRHPSQRYINISTNNFKDTICYVEKSDNVNCSYFWKFESVDFNTSIIINNLILTSNDIYFSGLYTCTAICQLGDYKNCNITAIELYVIPTGIYESPIRTVENVTTYEVNTLVVTTIVVILIVFALLLLLVFCCKRRKRKNFAKHKKEKQRRVLIIGRKDEDEKKRSRLLNYEESKMSRQIFSIKKIFFADKNFQEKNKPQTVLIKNEKEQEREMKDQKVEIEMSRIVKKENEEQKEKDEKENKEKKMISTNSDSLEEFQNQYKIKARFSQPMVESETSKFLIRVPLEEGKAPVPYPTEWSLSYSDYLDADKYIQMPHFNEDLWKLIEHSLNELLEKKNRNSKDVEVAIQKYHKLNHGNVYDGLHSYFVRLEINKSAAFFDDILPKIISLVLNSKKICTKPIPLLTKQRNCSVTMSQHQAACLLAHAFFCTIKGRKNKYPTFDFFGLYKSEKEGRFGKLDCLIHYFKRFFEGNHEQYGNVTFERQFIEPKSPDFWKDSTTGISQLRTSSCGTIETDGKGMLQVDFANKYLGGSVLRSGCYQEEIRFVICPEAIVSCLITEELDQNECLFITGCEQYSTYSGYAYSFKWAGDFQDTTKRDDWKRKMTEIVAMDALKILGYEDQFSEENLLRDVNKAFCGFSKPYSNNLPPVATGNWGCGTFGGDYYLKSLIQIMAASEAGRDVCYFTFGKSELESDLNELHSLLREKNKSVGFLWQCVTEFKNYLTVQKINLFQYISEKICTE